MEKPKITVVVPIYDVSKYLNQCVDSILGQTLKDIEVILVNDKSPDLDDDRICKEYEEEFDNVKYIKHEKNKGNGSARNTGIKHASSDYITFIDSDDWLEFNMLEELYNSAIESNSDIAQCYFYDHYGNNRELRKVKKYRRYASPMNAINVLLWNKIYKTELYVDNNIYFPEKVAGNDIATMTRLLYFVNSVALVKKGLYNYRKNRIGSITSDFSKILVDLPVVFNIIKDFLVSIDKLESDKIFLEKRVVKSLIHHLRRFKKDDRMTLDQKNELLKLHIDNSIKFLNMGRDNSYYKLNSAIRKLTYKNTLADINIILLNLRYNLSNIFLNRK